MQFCSFNIAILLLQFSCTTDADPEPRTLITEIGEFLTLKGYEIQIHSDNNLTAQGDYNKIEFLSFINEFYNSKGFPDVYDLNSLAIVRIEKIECFVGPILSL